MLQIDGDKSRIVVEKYCKFWRYEIGRLVIELVANLVLIDYTKSIDANFKFEFEKYDNGFIHFMKYLGLHTLNKKFNVRF